MCQQLLFAHSRALYTHTVVGNAFFTMDFLPFAIFVNYFFCPSLCVYALDQAIAAINLFRKSRIRHFESITPCMLLALLLNRRACGAAQQYESSGGDMQHDLSTCDIYNVILWSIYIDLVFLFKYTLVCTQLAVAVWNRCTSKRAMNVIWSSISLILFSVSRNVNPIHENRYLISLLSPKSFQNDIIKAGNLFVSNKIEG